MEQYEKEYHNWLRQDKKNYDELINLNSEDIKSRFSEQLKFGTGGLRAKMGLGTNRMNIWTLQKASFGVSKYLEENFGIGPVVIAYDTRNNSENFAELVAKVFAVKGHEVFLFSEPTPTPVLSYAIRKLNCIAGIVITASHNPKEYNGYKVYDNTGCQILPEVAAKITEKIESCKEPFFEEVMDNSDKITILDSSINNQFNLRVKQRFNVKSNNIKITYTSLHGSGLNSILNVLDTFDVNLVEEQANFDGDFPTVKSPNPEDARALELAIKCAKQYHSDLVLATDPDCDRIGVCVLHNNDYKFLTGNQIGALLIDFLINKYSLNRGIVVKTIVTNELGAEIAKSNNIEIIDTLTGFKYIGDTINKLDSNKQIDNFILGYEESFGFLTDTHTRDKDAVSSAFLISVMANEYKENGNTLIDRLNDLYAEYGYYLDRLLSLEFDGSQGQTIIEKLMAKLRTIDSKDIEELEAIVDYKLGIDELPKSDVLKLIFHDKSWLAVRPSGTEPKIKFYFSISSNNEIQASKKFENLKKLLEMKLNINFESM